MSYEADGNPQNYRKCTHDGCWRPFYARGLCYRHYLRLFRYGAPDERPRQRLPASFKVFTG